MIKTAASSEGAERGEGQRLRSARMVRSSKDRSRTSPQAPDQYEEGYRVRLMRARSRPATVSRRNGSSRAGEVVVAGAHGGAGATTLAVWLQPAWDAGVIRRPRRDGPVFSTGGLPLVLAVRNTVASAGRATGAVNALSSQGVRVDVLAVISDGLPEPAEASYRFEVLAARIPVTVRVPFVGSLRAARSPAAVDLPRRVQRAVAAIQAAALGQADAREFATTR